MSKNKTSGDPELDVSSGATPSAIAGRCIDIGILDLFIKVLSFSRTDDESITSSALEFSPYALGQCIITQRYAPYLSGRRRHEPDYLTSLRTNRSSTKGRVNRPQPLIKPGGRLSAGNLRPWHRARQGQVSVLRGAPVRYRYVRKSEQSAAYYEIDDVEALIVRLLCERYTNGGLSIGAITRLLNDQQIPTRKQTGRWEPFDGLGNAAQPGAAGFGRTQSAPRQRITRPLRLRGGIARDSVSHERSQAEWIAIAIPSIIRARPGASASQ
jgi:hypothetical protein